MSQTKTKIYDEKSQLKYCLQMNCLFCNLNEGIYTDCRHFENKKKAMDKKRNNV